MKKRTPTPIPPLGDAAIARIERGLFAALDARPPEPARASGARRRGLAFALAGVAAAVALFAVREGRRGETLPARAAQISTTTSGSRIALAGATLEVAPQSAVSFGGARDGSVVVVLDRGTVTCEVAPRSKRAPFIVEAGATRVTVIGTRFSVHRVGEHATVSVDHGLVEVADTNMTELVHAGERYRPGEPVMREALVSEAQAEPSAGAAAHGPATAAPPAVGAPTAAPAVGAPRRLPPSGAPTAAPAIGAPTAAPAVGAPTAASVGGAAPAALARSSATAPARRRRLALAAAPRSDDAQVDPRSAAATTVPAEVAAPDVATPPDVKPVEDASARRRSVQVLFELAAQLEVRDPEAALRIYGELAAGEDGWAASALFAAARLEAERGQAQRARELCETYLRRFPRGPNADDARTLLAPAR